MSELAARKTPIAASDLKLALTQAWCTKFGSEPPTNAVELLMSQSALETGAWAKCIAFNIGNVKSAGTSGDFCFFTTHEVVSPEQADRLVAASTPTAPAYKVSDTDVVLEPRHPGCRFRAFSTLDEGAAWYLDFLTTHYAAAWDAVVAGDPFAFVHSLKQHGYFTADEGQYLSGVCRFFDEYASPALADMTAIANALDELGYDATDVRLAVGQFQAAEGLTVDHTAGPMTRAKIRACLAAVPPPPEAA